jgi:hypothetical protein
MTFPEESLVYGVIYLKSIFCSEEDVIDCAGLTGPGIYPTIITPFFPAFPGFIVVVNEPFPPFPPVPYGYSNAPPHPPGLY